MSMYNAATLLSDARANFAQNIAADVSNTIVNEKTTEDTAVKFWYLTSSDTVKATPVNTQSLNRMRDPGTAESVVNPIDGRKLVNDEDFTTKDGKYRAIVKLFLLYDKQSDMKDNEAAWPIATGWLVAPDIVVTAGHCAFDHAHGLGRLVKAKAYVGYKGHDDLSNTESQWGIGVATTVKWLTGVGEEQGDVSIIKLANSFTTVSKYIEWTQTPISQSNAELGVVGYPGDIMNNGERGARMYEMFSNTTYNLTTSERNMLQYKIDTYGGNSGSPVFNNKKSIVSIGVHVLGGFSQNSASVFGGKYGNRFMAIQRTATSLIHESVPPSGATKPDENRPWLWEVTQTTTESESDVARQMLTVSMTEAKKVVASIPDKIIYAQPSIVSFGPDLGSEISVLAAAAIATAGRLAADSKNAAHAESLASTRPYDGIVSRAVLAEATLNFYSGNTLGAGDKEKVAEFMAPIVAGLAPFVMKTAPKLLNSVVVPGMRLLLSRISGNTTPERVRESRSVAAETETGFGRVLGKKEQEFFDSLVAVTKDDASTESFYSCMTSVGDFIGSAFKKAGPVLMDVAKIGLPLLIGTGGTGTEAATGATDAPAPPTSLDPLAHRAIVAEACLQSFIELQSDLDLGGKGFFPKLAGSVRTMGPKIVNVAPYAGQMVGPIVADMLREVDEKKRVAAKRQEFLDFSFSF